MSRWPVSAALGVLHDARARQRRRRLAIAIAIVAALVVGALVAGGEGGGRAVASRAAGRPGAGHLTTVGRAGARYCLISVAPVSRERRCAGCACVTWTARRHVRAGAQAGGSGAKSPKVR